jgi:hypothetical protein
MGYGSRALELLASYYQGDITSLSEVDEDDDMRKVRTTRNVRKLIFFRNQWNLHLC